MLLLALLVGGCVSAPAEPEARTVTVAPITGEEPSPAQVRREQLQAEIMRFADRYRERMNLEADRIRVDVATPDARWFAIGWQLGAAEATTAVAIGPNPVENLLDMLVLATLTREQAERFWVPAIVGEKHGQDLLSATRALEDDIWSIADVVLTPAQQQDLRALILEWIEANPDQHYFWGIRLAGFSGQRAAELNQVVRSGGLLGEVRETRRTVDEMRDFGERVMFYMQNMYSLMRLNAQLAVYDAMGQPEFAQMMASSQNLTQTAERFAVVAESLPDRELEVINQLMAGLTVQRQELLDDLLREEARLRGVLVDLREALVVGTEITENISETAQVAERLAERLNLGEGGADGEPMTPEQMQQMLSDVSQIAAEYKLLLQEVNTLVATPAWDQRVPQVLDVLGRVDTEIDQLVYLIFALNAGLIVLIFVGLFAYRYANARWVAPKLPGKA
jgi:uncharacterized protein Yka (UPF0111/DUF47 family)